ncbi:hypothetical protein ACFP56_10970 [Paenibacillus septentrionalis]|uniref:Lipoprotein n=1 Tax=Paenibacillus septentrionalis TaxID=429342 RepID=A0ABW1V5W8_9BACL
MRYLLKALIISFILIISGCATQGAVNLDVKMAHIIDYKLYDVGADLSDDVNKWLINARMSGEEGQYFIYQFANKDKRYMNSYVYRKGSSDYEVSFIYDPSDSSAKGKIHVTGIGEELGNEKIVEIKSINDLSFLFILSDESLKDRLE